MVEKGIELNADANRTLYLIDDCLQINVLDWKCLVQLARQLSYPVVIDVMTVTRLLYVTRLLCKTFHCKLYWTS